MHSIFNNRVNQLIYSKLIDMVNIILCMHNKIVTLKNYRFNHAFSIIL